MAHRKARVAAPKTTAPHSRRRHGERSGWLPKALAQAFSNIVAPLLVGLALQGVRGHDLLQMPPAPGLGGTTTSAATSSPRGPTGQETATSYKTFFADQALPTPDGLLPPAPPAGRDDQAAHDYLGVE